MNARAGRGPAWNRQEHSVSVGPRRFSLPGPVFPHELDLVFQAGNAQGKPRVCGGVKDDKGPQNPGAAWIVHRETRKPRMLSEGNNHHQYHQPTDQQ